MKSLDDVFFFVDEFPVGKNRSFLPVIVDHAVHAEYGSIIKTIANLRDVLSLSFSVSVSNVGEKNYTPKEIKEKVVEALKYAYNWEQKEDGTQTLNLRVFIEKEECLLGVRVGIGPLHRRNYKQETLPGSLKPPVAYGMLALAHIASRDVVLDPLCGVGTIALEAAAFTSNIIAGDISAEALRVAQESNMTDADIAFCQWDARHIELEDACVDHIVTNLPFDKQIAIGEPEHFFGDLLEEFKRVLKN